MKKDILKISGVNFISQLLGFLFTTFLSGYFSPEIFGRFYLVLSIQLIITLLVEGGVNTKFVTSLARKEINENQIYGILTGRIITSTVLTAIFILTGKIFPKLYFSNVEIVAIVIGVYGWVLFSSANLFFQATKRFNSLGINLIATAILKLLGLIIILNITHDLYELALFIFFIAPLITGTLFLYLIGKKIEFNLNLQKYYQLSLESKYIFISIILVTLIVRCDVFMIQLMSNELELGNYSISSNLTNALPPISLAISTVILPQINSILKKQDKTLYKKRIFKMTPYWILFVVFGASTGIVFIQFFYSTNQEIISTVFGILFLSFSFSILINPISLIYYDSNREYILTRINLFQLIGNVLFNILLIPLLGAIGAALSTLIIKSIGSYFIVKHA